MAVYLLKWSEMFVVSIPKYEQKINIMVLSVKVRWEL